MHDDEGRPFAVHDDHPFVAGDRLAGSAETAILPFEPGGVANTGDVGGELIAEVEGVRLTAVPLGLKRARIFMQV